MKTPEITNLPAAEVEYSQSNEALLRRAVEQSIQDLRFDVVDNRNKTDKAASLAVRRFQFLLMGAP